MGLIDFSPLFQPIPESPEARGFGSLNKSIEAILERRRLQKQHEEQQRGLAERARMDDARLREQFTLNAEVDREKIAQQEAAARAAAQQQQQRLSFDQQKERSDVFPKAQELYNKGAPEMGQELMRNAGITRPMDNIEDFSLESMLQAPVAPRGPAGNTAEDLDEFERAGGPQAMQAEDAATEKMYGQLGQQGLILPEGNAVPFSGPPTLALRARGMAEKYAGLKGQHPLLDRAVDDVVAGVASSAIPYDKAGDIVAAARAEIEKNKRAAMVNRGETLRPGEQARLEQGAVTSLRTDINVWKDENKYEILRGTLEDLAKAEQEIKSGNQVLETGVRFALGRKIAGPGVFTEGEQKAILGRVGGEFKRWEQLVQTFEDGTLTTAQQKIFLKAIRHQLHYTRNEAAKKLASNFDETYLGMGSPYESMQGNVLNWRNRLLRPFGVPQVKVEGRSVQLVPGAEGPRTKPAKAKSVADDIVDEMTRGQ